MFHRHSARRADGYACLTTAEGVKERDTQQCCHCSGHFNVVPGSGKVRGWCTLCNRVTCGQPACNEHFPFEKRMDLYEKGRLLDLMGSLDTVLPEHRKLILPGQ